MEILTIKSRVSKISQDKRNRYGIVSILDIVVQPIMIFVECVGIIMDIHGPAIDYWSERCLDHVHTFPNP